MPVLINRNRKLWCKEPSQTPNQP